jgi:SagB-type dehydrogenase family enzyme
LPESHSLQRQLAIDLRRELQNATLDQECVGDAPVCLVIAMDIDQMGLKYGRRAEQYCLLEAGHAAQNVLLEAVSLGLGSVPVGAFDDRAVKQALHLPTHLRPAYLLPVGYPR